MNCTDFNAVLHEFLDETLRADIQEAARDHIKECGDCRRALMREEAFARSIGQSLERATACVSLQPETRRNILAAASKSQRRRPWLDVWQGFISSIARPACASAVLLCLVVLFVAIQWFRRAAPPSEITAEPSQHSWVINVPIPVQTHVFEDQNGMVVDAVVTEVAIGHVRFY